MSFMMVGKSLKDIYGVLDKLFTKLQDKEQEEFTTIIGDMVDSGKSKDEILEFLCEVCDNHDLPVAFVEG